MTELPGRDQTLRDYMRIIARRKWMLVLAVVSTIVAAVALSAVQDKVYEAESQMLVETRPADTVFSDGSQIAVDPVRALDTEIKVLQSQSVAQRVQSDLGLSAPPPDAVGTVEGATDVVSVAVRSADPTTARLLADAYVHAYIEIKRDQAVATLVDAGSELQKKASELQTQIDALDKQVTDAPADQQAAIRSGLAPQRQILVDQQALFKQRFDQLQVDAALATGGAQVVHVAEQPSSPVEPKPLRNGALGLIVGLLIGLGAVFLVDHFDDSIRDADDAKRAVGLPVLVTVPKDAPPDQRPIAISRSGDFAVERYKNLRASIQFLGIDKPINVILVTSPISGEGKTTTASNLAVVFAAAGHRVVIVDADLRRPRLHEVFSVPNNEGLTTVLLGEMYGLAVHQVVPNLDVLPSGPLPPNPGEVVGGRQMQSLITELAADYDYVIIDSAPVLPVSDSVSLAPACDGVLLVVQAGRTSRRHAAEAVALLQRANTAVLGVVLNNLSVKADPSYGYGYGYDYSADPAPAAAVAEPQKEPSAKSSQA